jgi:hypothetical protein
MAKKIFRMPYTPKSVQVDWTNQTIRLSVRDNKRLKRAALRKKMSFNAWAVMILMDAADRTLEPQRKITSITGDSTTNGKASE